MSVTEQGNSDTANGDSRHDIRVSVETEFLPDQSDAESDRWVFAYHISIHNQGAVSARLLTRHWVITDGDERVQEVLAKAFTGAVFCHSGSQVGAGWCVLSVFYQCAISAASGIRLR